MEAALTQAAEQYNSGGCNLETFVMRMVAICGRDVVVESLHAVGYGTTVRIRSNSPGRQIHRQAATGSCSAGAASCWLQDLRSVSKPLLSACGAQGDEWGPERSPPAVPQQTAAPQPHVEAVSPVHSAQAPATAAPGPQHHAVTAAAASRPAAKACANCCTVDTPLWRKDPVTGIVMCNACGIYYKNHGFHRPLQLIDHALVRHKTSANDWTFVSLGRPLHSDCLNKPTMDADMTASALTRIQSVLCCANRPVFAGGAARVPAGRLRLGGGRDGRRAEQRPLGVGRKRRWRGPRQASQGAPAAGDRFH